MIGAKRLRTRAGSGIYQTGRERVIQILETALEIIIEDGYPALTLREVARLTGGEYHHGGTAEALRGVYQQLGSRLLVKKRQTDLTALLAGLGAAAARLSVVWFGRRV